MSLIVECQMPSCEKEFVSIPSVQAKFCSMSCSAKYNNSRRKPRSIESKKKTSDSIKRYVLRNPKEKTTPTMHTNVCKECLNTFTHRSKAKGFCSKSCVKIGLSKIRKKYLQEHAGTFNWISNNQPTYFEKSFTDWLDRENISGYQFNCYRVINYEADTSYVLDVYFPELRLNFELDGTHHERPEQILRDQIRDEFLNRTQGISIHRISIRDYNKANGRQKCWDQAKEIIVGALERS